MDRPQAPRALSHLVLWVHRAPEKVGTRYKEWEETLWGLLDLGWVWDLSARQYCPTVVVVLEVELEEGEAEVDLSTRDSG